MKNWTILLVTLLFLGLIFWSCSEDTITNTEPDPPTGMTYVEGGSFDMGDHFNEGDSTELPVHSVTLDDYYIGKCETTQKEWAMYMPPESYSNGSGDNYPVYRTSWYSILKYCNLRSISEGFIPCYKIYGSTDPSVWGEVPESGNPTWNSVVCDWTANGYRLPSEAEWEYSARGGIYWQDNYRYSGSDTLDVIAWCGSNSGNTSHPVGTKRLNQLGLYDMSGNVEEYCWDRYSDSYYEYCVENNIISNPYGSSSNYYRVQRGGYWSSSSYCRVVNRDVGYYPYDNYFSYGFRVAKSKE